MDLMEALARNRRRLDRDCNAPTMNRSRELSELLFSAESALATARAEIERLGDLLVEIEVISDENCTETGGIARSALFQIRSKIHHAAVRQARGGE